MRKLSAHYIFTSCSPPLKNGIIILDNEGLIVDIVDTKGKLKEESNLEFYPGILVPGFVNTHCHLELSHLLGLIPEKTGITGFIDQVTGKRLDKQSSIKKDAIAFTKEMYRIGISAVGDIVNTSDTIEVKKDSPIIWHNFIELFGLNPLNAQKIWKKGLELKQDFNNKGLRASITPHAPYSISTELWKIFQSNPSEFFSIHNQESAEEELLMTGRTGKMANWLHSNGLNPDNLPDCQRSSLQSVLGQFPATSRVLLVHNTFSSKEDIEIAIDHFGNESTFWVLCPNANLYIEDSLPTEIINNRDNIEICLGTDSLASNSKLSILSEMKTIQNNYPDVKLEELVKWSSINGARALGIEKKIGSFEVGKKPGIVWIDKINFQTQTLSQNSKSKRLL